MSQGIKYNGSLARETIINISPINSYHEGNTGKVC